MTNQTELDTREEAAESCNSTSVETLIAMRKMMQETVIDNHGVELPTTINVADLSDYTQDIIEHFGVECPALLNHYANTIEDCLIQMTKANKEIRKELARCHTEIDGYQDFRDRLVDDFATIRKLVKAEAWDQLTDVLPALGK